MQTAREVFTLGRLVRIVGPVCAFDRYAGCDLSDMTGQAARQGGGNVQVWLTAWGVAVWFPSSSVRDWWEHERLIGRAEAVAA